MTEDKRRTADGVVTDDPSKVAPVGTVMEFHPTPFKPVIDKGAGAIVNWDYFGSVLLIISFSDGETYRADGSAVLIGPGLALAARHVFDPVMDDMLAGKLAPVAVSILPGERILIWRVSQIVIGETDVAILTLNLSSEVPTEGFQVATLTTRTPTKGEPVMIAGARAGEGAPLGSSLALDVRIGVGEVGDLHLDGRDRVMLPNPCAAISCLTLGGMSGGPAFDQHGNVIGILTSSFEHDEGPTYVSFWWPVILDAIETIWPSDFVPLPTSLNALATGKGLVFIDKPEAIELIDDSGSNKSFVYKPWS